LRGYKVNIGVPSASYNSSSVNRYDASPPLLALGIPPAFASAGDFRGIRMAVWGFARSNGRGDPGRPADSLDLRHRPVCPYLLRIGLAHDRSSRPLGPVLERSGRARGGCEK